MGFLCVLIVKVLFDVIVLMDFVSDMSCINLENTSVFQVVSNNPFTKPLLLRNGHKAGKGVITVSALAVCGFVHLIHIDSFFTFYKIENKRIISKEAQ